MSHAVLLGDSIFDNASYVPGGPDVIAQLRAHLAIPSACEKGSRPRSSPGWTATLLAIDGSVTTDVAIQLRKLPADATHLVVSVGGNDALGCSSLVETTDAPAAEIFDELAVLQTEFRRDYRDMLRAVLAAGKPTVVCTVYDAIPDLPPAKVTGLSVFNDVIVREAASAGVPVLDLRAVCDRHVDYSDRSPIEPSRVGGSKIAAAIAAVLTGHDFGTGRTVIYGPARG